MSECDDCGICGLSIKDKFSYTLVCNHTFHYECLMKSFNNISYTINNKKSNQCPYCRKNSEYLPLVNGLKKIIPGIHCSIFGNEIDDKKKLLKEEYNQKCDYILTRGKNKDNPCGKNCILGYNTCKTHIGKVDTNQQNKQIQQNS